MATGQCPSSTLKFPLSLFPKALDLPPPSPIPPASYLASPLCPWPPACHPTPASQSLGCTSRVGEPQAGFIAAPGCGQVWNRQDPVRLSACDWLRASWAGLGKTGMQLPRPLSASWSNSRELCSRQGDPGRGLLSHRPRGGGAQDLRAGWRLAEPLRFSELPTATFLRFHCLRSRCPPSPLGVGSPACPIRAVP